MKWLIAIVVALGILYIGSLVYLAVSVAQFTAYWKKQNNAKAPQTALVYVALGDSAAQGIGAYTPSADYVAQFAKRLATHQQRPVHVVNLSKSGAKIQDVINDQIPQLNTYHPDVITLDIGGNDIAVFDKNTFEREFAKLISLLPPKTLVANVPYFGGRTQLPLLGAGTPERSVLTANKIILNLAKQKPVVVVPLHDVTARRTGRRIWYYAPDYFHPNNLGYKAWTDAFWMTYLNSIK